MEFRAVVERNRVHGTGLLFDQVSRARIDVRARAPRECADDRKARFAINERQNTRATLTVAEYRSPSQCPRSGRFSASRGRDAIWAGAPGLPAEPTAPVAPVGPVAPAGPARPIGPAAPGAPTGPIGPTMFQIVLVSFPPHTAAADTSLNPPLELLTHASRTFPCAVARLGIAAKASTTDATISEIRNERSRRASIQEYLFRAERHADAPNIRYQFHDGRWRVTHCRVGQEFPRLRVSERRTHADKRCTNFVGNFFERIS